MDAYTVFAEVYDLFMEEVPYEEWRDFLVAQMGKNGITDGLVLDLGCGTGTLTTLLAKAGYDMIGVDLSEDMLERAFEKRQQEDLDILYLCQDMCSFELYGTVRAVICACDSLNYITKQSDLKKVFRLVNNYLDPGGLFLFDMNTPYKYRELLGDHVFADNSDHGSFIWENHFDEEEQINEYALTLYLREEHEKYQRFEEYHYQRAYDRETVERLLKEAGLELLAVYDNYTEKAPSKDCERLCFVARECEKNARDRHMGNGRKE